MAFDFKKEYPALYAPKAQPALIDVPPMNYLAVRGAGDPNAEGGEYRQSLSLLYGVAYTLKMSPRAGHAIEGYFDFVVPPPEGFWRQEGTSGIDYARKADLRFISAIRLPDFVTREVFDWAVNEATVKKKADFSKVEFLPCAEGLCVQCLHLGPYDAEPDTVSRMDAFLAAQGCAPDFSEARLHHEIYLSDPRKTAPDRLRTVLRHPVRRL